MKDLIDWTTTHALEILAALVSITYVILAIREVIWLWLFGFLSAALYAWVYGHSGFYAGMALQGYYGFISVYGWIHWKRNGRGEDGNAKLPVSRLPLKIFLILVGVWIVLWISIGLVLSNFTDSTIPFWDGFTTAGGIVATWMLARKYLEQWLFWMVIDSFSIGLYLSKGLYATTVLYGVYIIMAVTGYSQWRKAWKAQA